MMQRFVSVLLLGMLLIVPGAAADNAPDLDSGDETLEQHLVSLKTLANKGDLHATQQIYMRYGVAGYPEQARAWAERYNERLKQKASGGDVGAMLQLGARYLRGGDYTPKDIAKATEWFSRAGEAGDPTGLYMLGELFSDAGNAAQAKQSYKRAYDIYAERAKEGEDAQALYCT